MNLIGKSLPLILVPLVSTFPNHVLASSSSYGALSLSDFLRQVETQNPASRAATESAQAAQLKLSEAELLTSPQLFSTVQTGKDQREGLFFRYQSVTSTQYTLGVQQQTSYGLAAKLSYTLTTQEYTGLPDTLLLSNPVLAGQFYEGLPKLELTQSLWRNAWGSETRALQSQLEAASAIQLETEKFKKKMTLTQASATYWRLSLAREATAIAQETLGRASRLSEWSKKRAQLGLADQSDALQGEAAVQLRKLQLRAAQDEERSARLAFNSARGKTGDSVDETLSKIPATTELHQTPSTLPSNLTREDLIAAEKNLSLSEASAELGRARNTPSLDLFASAALNSRDSATADAVSNSFGTEQPTLGVGIKLVLPLDAAAWTSAREGYARDRQAAELQLERKRLEVQQEWTDLQQKIADSQARLGIADLLVETQERKANAERERFNKGRSTTYQVLTFEEDYAQSRLNRLRSQFELQTLTLQLNTFITHASQEGASHDAR